MDGCANSQPARVEWFVAFSGGFLKKRVEAWPRLGVGQPLFPRFIILPGEKKPGKIRQLHLFVRRQRLAHLNDFRSGVTHAVTLPMNRALGKANVARPEIARN